MLTPLDDYPHAIKTTTPIASFPKILWPKNPLSDSTRGTTWHSQTKLIVWDTTFFWSLISCKKLRYYLIPSRSSQQKCSMKKCVLRNFTKFTGKHFYKSLFFNKVAGLRPATLFKKKTLRRRFPVKFVKISKNTFFTKHLSATTAVLPEMLWWKNLIGEQVEGITAN